MKAPSRLMARDAREPLNVSMRVLAKPSPWISSFMSVPSRSPAKTVPSDAGLMVQNPSFYRLRVVIWCGNCLVSKAYRQVGMHVTEGLFSSALMGDYFIPMRIPQWFRYLAGSFLEPGKS